ncbi:DUF6093 family protein [Pseudonocardia xishanensis]|uniref:Head-to-tail stopper n=1 Tax=Pseudonocardia xishanensis TaxID=630995 RepID=A0ABP8RSS1_9PSEU
MTVDSILRRARRQREQLMRSTCRILRPGGDPVFDPATGEYTTPDEAVVYEGRCRVKQPGSAYRDPDSGERELIVGELVVELPWAQASANDPVRVDGTVVVTASDDAWIIGKRLPVLAVTTSSDTGTHYEVRVVSQDRPGDT